MKACLGRRHRWRREPTGGVSVEHLVKLNVADADDVDDLYARKMDGGGERHMMASGNLHYY